jgi:hypothetical protein
VDIVFSAPYSKSSGGSSADCGGKLIVQKLFAYLNKDLTWELSIGSEKLYVKSYYPLSVGNFTHLLLSLILKGIYSF